MTGNSSAFAGSMNWDSAHKRYLMIWRKSFVLLLGFVCWRYGFWRTMRHTYPTPPRLSQAPEAVNESEASRDKKMALDQPVVAL